jgi:hypothetical protein
VGILNQFIVLFVPQKTALSLRLIIIVAVWIPCGNTGSMSMSIDHAQPDGKSVPFLLFSCLRFSFLASSRAGPCSSMSCWMDFLG